MSGNILLLRNQFESMENCLEERLATIIAHITTLDHFAFEKELLVVAHDRSLFKLLSQLLTSDLNQQQKSLACSGVNYVVKTLIAQEHTLCPTLWQDYLQHYLQHSPQIDWCYLHRTLPALKLLLEELILADQFLLQANSNFTDIPFTGKLIMYDAFLAVQCGEAMGHVFVRETVEEFIANILIFIRQIHSQKEQFIAQYHSLQTATVACLEELIEYISQRSSHIGYRQILLALSMQQPLIDIIIELLVYNPTKCRNNLPFSIDQIKDITIFCGIESSNLTVNELQSINQLKADAFRIFSLLVSNYDHTSGLAQFDYHFLLTLMENIVPIIVQSLKQISAYLSAGRQRLFTIPSYLSVIITALLDFLSISLNFVFLLNFFVEQHLGLIVEIILPFIRFTEEEEKQFEDDRDQYISLTEQFVQGNQAEVHDELDKDKCTVRNQCAKLLENIFRRIDGSLTSVVQLCSSMIIEILEGVSFEQSKTVLRDYPQVDAPTLSTCFLLLTEPSLEYQSREDLLEELRTLLAHPGIFTLQRLDLAQLLLFLTYNFTALYGKPTSAEPGEIPGEIPENGYLFLSMTKHSLTMHPTIIKCSLLFLKNCIQVGLDSQIWTNLLSHVLTTSDQEIIKLLRSIVRRMLTHLPSHLISQLITKLITRLVIQWQSINKETDRCLPGTPMLYICLELLSHISADPKYLQEQPDVVDAIWPVFDFFQYSATIEYGDQVLNIFNNLLKANLVFAPRYFAYLTSFKDILVKHQQFGPLLQTYTLMLQSQAVQEYYDTGDGKRKLIGLAESILEIYSWVKKETVMVHVCWFMDYIMLRYPGILREESEQQRLNYTQNHSQPSYKLFQFQTEEVLQASPKPSTVAAIVNYRIFALLQFGESDLDVLSQCRIEMFSGEAGILLALCLRRLIEKTLSRQYAKYGIRLLHFIYTQTKEEKSQKVSSNLRLPKFKLFEEIDPFQEVLSSLHCIKQSVAQQQYDSLMRDIDEQIEIGQVRDLLSRRYVDKGIRVVRKIKTNL